MRQVILNFHGLGAPARTLELGEAPYWVAPEFFEEVLVLAERYRDQVRTDFTFDDGNLSDLEIAAPALAHHGRTATFFVLADRIDQPGSLGAADIRALATAGHGIGTHGAGHVDWSAADPATLERELGAQTRDAIGAAAGAPVTDASIPFGRYNAAVLRALATQGYDRVYSSDGGAWCTGQRPVPRTSPRAEMTLADVEDILMGREPMRAQGRRILSRAWKGIR